LRLQEYQLIEQRARDGSKFVAAYSTKAVDILEAKMNIVRTLFICLVLSLSSIFFTRDAQFMVFEPMERMIERVRVMASDPLAAANGEYSGLHSFAIKLTSTVD